MSNVLYPQFGERSELPLGWESAEDFFNEYRTTASGFQQDMQIGVQRAVAEVGFCFGAADVPVILAELFKSEHAQGRLHITAADFGDTNGVMLRRLDDLLGHQNTQSRFNITIGPRAVAAIAERLMDVVYPQDKEDFQAVRSSAAEALTYVGIGMYINQLAASRQSYSERRQTVLSVTSKYGLGWLDGSLYGIHEDFAGALVGGALYSRWVEHYLAAEEEYRSESIISVLKNDLHRTDESQGFTLLRVALAMQASHDEIARLLSF